MPTEPLSWLSRPSLTVCPAAGAGALEPLNTPVTVFQKTYCGRFKRSTKKQSPGGISTSRIAADHTSSQKKSMFSQVRKWKVYGTRVMLQKIASAPESAVHVPGMKKLGGCALRFGATARSFLFDQD